MKKIFILLAITQISLINSLELNVKKVSLFKNGYGYFNSELLLDSSKHIKVTDIPVQTHGTFWIKGSENLLIDRIYSTKATVDKKSDFKDISDLLKVNIGREIKVTKAFKDSSSISGIIKNVNSNILILKSKKGTEVVKISSIEDIFFLSSDDIETSITESSDVTELNILLEKPAPKEVVNLEFMARDITWSPSYIIDITDPNKALFTAKALIINEAYDLNSVQVDFITGFPGIKYSNKNSPMSMADSIHGYLSSNRSNNYVEYDEMSQSLMNIQSNSLRSVPEYRPQEDVEGSEDLFFYPVKDVTLKKGDTAYIPLFTLETKYKHIYTLSIPNYINAYGQQIESLDPVVFHSIKIANSGKLPWTTAPVQFISKGNFVGQDINNYTPPGSEGIIKINNALNIAVDDTETEIDRVRDSDKFNRVSYDLVTLTGEILIKNGQNNEVDMEIDKSITGEVLNISDSGESISSGRGLKKINPNAKLKWNIKLKPLEERTLFYSYKIYIRD